MFGFRVTPEQRRLNLVASLRAHGWVLLEDDPHEQRTVLGKHGLFGIGRVRTTVWIDQDGKMKWDTHASLCDLP